MDRTFLTRHDDWNAHQTMAFVLPAGEAKAAYVDPMWGVFIDGVLVDGQDVPPETYHGTLDDVDFRQMETRGASLVLHVLLSDLKFAHHFQSESDFTLVTYDVPMHSGLIEIRYRPRFGPGVFGAECKLVSSRF